MDGIRSQEKRVARMRSRSLFGVARQRQIGHRLQRTAPVPAGSLAASWREPRRRLAVGAGWS